MKSNAYSTSRVGEINKTALTKTAWFPPNAKPVRVGVYQVDCGGDADKWPEFHYWNGRRWWYGANTPDGTVREFLSAPRHEVRPLPKQWRGLASNPARSSKK